MRRFTLTAALAGALLAAAAASAGRTPITVAFPFQNGATLSGTVAFPALTNGPVQKVEFVVDGRIRWQSTRAPFGYGDDGQWDTSAEIDGTHTLELWAYAADGSVPHQTIQVTTRNSMSVQIVAPPRGSKVKPGTTVKISASGTVQPDWVELIVDGRVVDTSDQSPFSFKLDPDLKGQHWIGVYAVSGGGRTANDGISVTITGSASSGSSDTDQTASTAWLYSDTLKLRAQAWSWQALMRTPRTTARAPIAGDRSGLLDLHRFWRDHARAARAKAAAPPHLNDWLCIHHYEGAWTANTGNGYWGGLQMNMDFMRGYGPELLHAEGTADRWSPLEQIWVAVRAWRSRGFEPWPQTAHFCGLI